jgi:hypothetical protein
VPFDIFGSPLQKTPIIAAKNEPFSQEMHQKKPLIMLGFEIVKW